MAAKTDHHPDASTTSLLKPIEYQSALSKSSESLEQPEYRYSYADENFNYYPSQNAAFTEEKAHVPQLANAVRESRYEDFDDAEPFVISSRASSVREKRPNPFEKYFGFYPLEQRIEDKKRGIGVQKYPIVVWTLSAVMLGVLIYELVVNAKAQGSPFSFKPVVNPMLGPSPSALIHVGARFPPCMKDVQGLSSSTSIACLNDTANPPDKICSIEDVCGFGGFHDQTPNQWFRFITPIFLHAGLIHFLLNMLAQLTCSAQVEREMGSIGFLVLYAAAGIFGNVLGGNFSLVGSPSVGASGAIFGTVAVAWVDLFAHWRYQYRPGRKLAFMAIELIIGIAIGYIPYVDNFAHLGGLVMGLLVGMVLYPIISPSTRHRVIVWCFRLAAIPAAILLFYFLIHNFYTSDPYAACTWCRYLSCIPASYNNHCKGFHQLLGEYMNSINVSPAGLVNDGL